MHNLLSRWNEKQGILRIVEAHEIMSWKLTDTSFETAKKAGTIYKEGTIAIDMFPLALYVIVYLLGYFSSPIC
jgi:uncharacterized membrane protein